jgi:predicted DNA-binding transcriptional regulator AlpA
MELSNTTTPKYVRVKDIGKLFGISPVTVWKWVAKGKLPQAHAKLSPKCTVWLRSDIDEVIKNIASDSELREVSNG